MENLIQGEKDLFEIEIEGLKEGKVFDEGIRVVLDFFVKGKRRSGVVTVDTLYPTGEDNKFYVVVDTSTLPEGELVCEVTIEYPNPLVVKQLIGKAYNTTECNITINR